MSGCLKHIPVSVKTPTVLQSFTVSSLFQTLLQEKKFQVWKLESALPFLSQIQLTPGGIRAKLSNYFRAYRPTHKAFGFINMIYKRCSISVSCQWPQNTWKSKMSYEIKLFGNRAALSSPGLQHFAFTEQHCYFWVLHNRAENSK